MTQESQCLACEKMQAAPDKKNEQKKNGAAKVITFRPRAHRQ